MKKKNKQDFRLVRFLAAFRVKILVAKLRRATISSFLHSSLVRGKEETCENGRYERRRKPDRGTEEKNSTFFFKFFRRKHLF